MSARDWLDVVPASRHFPKPGLRIKPYTEPEDLPVRERLLFWLVEHADHRGEMDASDLTEAEALVNAYAHELAETQREFADRNWAALAGVEAYALRIGARSVADLIDPEKNGPPDAETPPLAPDSIKHTEVVYARAKGGRKTVVAMLSRGDDGEWLYFLGSEQTHPVDLFNILGRVGFVENEQPGTT